MIDTKSTPLTKGLLRAFLVSIVATAVVGAACLAVEPGSGWFPVFQFRVFATTVTIAAASVCGLLCSACLTIGRKVLPTTGLILVAVTFVLALIGIWIEPRADWFYKTIGITTAFGVGCSHLSMLLLMKLRGRARSAHIVAYYAILGLCTLISIAVVGEIGDTGYWRGMGVVSVVVAAVTLMIPVLSYLGRSSDSEGGSIAAISPFDTLEDRIARCERELQALYDERDRLQPENGEPDDEAARG
ncbi:MAG: hypothetical protein AAF266_10285 [Planctomycetota bacterium]